MKARRRAAALDVPGSIDEARALIADYVSAERRAAQIMLDAANEIDAIKVARDLGVAALRAAQPARFAALKAWWEAGGRAVAGSRRSAELGGANLGIRLSPPSVRLGRGVKPAEVIDWLKIVGGRSLFRIKEELDKPAIIKAWHDGTPWRDALCAAGVAVVQVDEFFIDAGIAEPVAAAEEAL